VAARADITLKPVAGLTPEQAHSARARAWLYIWECFLRRNGKEGGPDTAPDSAKKGSNDSSAESRIPEPYPLTNTFKTRAPGRLAQNGDRGR
jgi:hypothetical protein